MGDHTYNDPVEGGRWQTTHREIELSMRERTWPTTQAARLTYQVLLDAIRGLYDFFRSDFIGPISAATFHIKMHLNGAGYTPVGTGALRQTLQTS